MNNEYSMGFESNEQGVDESAPVSSVKKRRAFAYWTVDNTEIKLKLNTASITKLEEKYKKNLLFLITGDMPTVATMLTIIQAAAAPWNAGMDTASVMKLYDTYVAEGHTQNELLESVIVPIMGVSGFLSADQMDQVEALLNK